MRWIHYNGNTWGVQVSRRVYAAYCHRGSYPRWAEPDFYYKYTKRGTVMDKEYEGHVTFADGSIVSLQCFEGRPDECPRELPNGYLCEGSCPEPD